MGWVCFLLGGMGHDGADLLVFVAGLGCGESQRWIRLLESDVF